MRQRISAFLGNESTFGRIMARLWVIIGSNLCFLFFSIPIVTIGPSLAGLYHVVLKSYRAGGDIGVFREFWTGFRENFKQGILTWLGLLAFGILAYVDLRFSAYMGGVLSIFKVTVYIIILVVALVATHFYPVLAAFSDTLPGLLRNAVFFAAKNPLRALVILFVNVAPFVVTVIDTHMQPLFVFLWASCGFSLVASLSSWLLLKDFEKFLPVVDEYGNFLEGEEIVEYQKRMEEKKRDAQKRKERKKRRH